MVLGCGRPVPGEASGGHAATHTAVSVTVEGGEEWMRWDEEVGEVVLEGGGRECTMHGWVKRS